MDGCEGGGASRGGCDDRLGETEVLADGIAAMRLQKIPHSFFVGQKRSACVTGGRWVVACSDPLISLYASVFLSLSLRSVNSADKGEALLVGGGS